MSIRLMKSALSGAMALTLMSASSAWADTLIENVEGIAVNEQGQVERFNGLLIGTDGRVKERLRRGDKRPSKVDYQLDGKGRVMMPGLVDSHVRVMDLGIASLTLDLSQARSLSEAQGRIAAWAAAHPDAPWIIGQGWNPSLWMQNDPAAASTLPGAADLDQIIANRPVWLVDAQNTSGWANSAALTAAGITATTKDPSGGRIERIAGSTKPSGILLGTAMALVDKAAPSPRAEDRDHALAVAQEKLLQRGITAVADMGTTIDDWQSFRRAGDAGALRLRIMAYADGVDAMSLIGGPGPTPWLYGDRLRLNGVAFQIDGSVATGGALLSAPYVGRQVGGVAIYGDSQLRNMMSRAAIDKFQIAAIANGDAAVSAATAAFQELAQTYKGDRRWRIEGIELLPNSDAALMKQLGIIASMQPVRIASDRNMWEKQLGPDRLPHVEALNSLSAAGVGLALGTGTPGRNPEPFANIATAITRSGADGQPFGGWQPQQRLTREQALAAAAVGGAYAGFAEERFGRLTRGQRADFILVDRDPTLATTDELHSIKVLEVWIDGQLAWKPSESREAR